MREKEKSGKVSWCDTRTTAHNKEHAAATPAYRFFRAADKGLNKLLRANGAEALQLDNLELRGHFRGRAREVEQRRVRTALAGGQGVVARLLLDLQLAPQLVLKLLQAVKLWRRQGSGLG